MRDLFLQLRNSYSYPIVSLEREGQGYVHQEHPSIAALHNYHLGLLTDANTENRVLGIASVIYWGNYGSEEGGLQPELAMDRANRASLNANAANVATQLDNAIDHIAAHEYGAAALALCNLYGLGFAFASKVCAFLRPSDCGVIDKVIASKFPIFDFRGDANGYVTSTHRNAACYDDYCHYLQFTRDKMNGFGPNYKWTDHNDGSLNDWQAVDVERALYAIPA